MEAEESYYDIWQVDVQTYPDGSIFKIRDKQEVDTGEKQLSRGFCNYFGVGIDARICYSVEMRRKQNKWLNLMLYGCIGVCKLCQGIRSIR